MDRTLHIVIDYLTRGALQTGRQLLFVLGPMLVIAVVLQYVSRFVRTRAARAIGFNAYIYLTAPGVMIHELGHAFFCVTFLHKIVKMQLFSPKADGTLGHVDHSYNPKSTYQKIGNFFIGTGPIWFGTATIYLLSQILLDHSAESHVAGMTSSDAAFDFVAIGQQVLAGAWQLFAGMVHPQMFSSWQFWLFVYLVFCIGSHITLSPPDIAGAWRGFVSLVAFMLIVNLLTLWLDQGYSARACEELVRACVSVYSVCLFVIGLNLALGAVMFVLSAVRRSLE